MTKAYLKRALFICVLPFASLAHATDWPTYMKDYSRVGQTPDPLPRELTEQWVRTSATPPEWAWPGPGGKVIEGLELKHRVRFDDVFHVVIAGQSLFYGSSVDNTVYCVDVQSGTTQWQFVTSGPVRLAPTIAAGRLYVGSDDGHVYCLNTANGQRIWQLRAGPRDERILARGRMASRWPVRTGVLVDDGVAYFGAGVFPHETVYLYAVDANTGDLIWKNDSISQRDAGRNDLSPQGYLLANADRLFVPSGRTLPAAFDRVTGKMLHKQLGGGKQIGGAEALLDDDDILSVGEHHILALDQQEGRIDNRLRGRRMTLRDQMAFIADGKQVMAIDRPQFEKVKQRRLDLEAQLARIQRDLRRNLAPAHLQRLQEAQQMLTEAQSLKVSQAELAEFEEKLAAAQETYSKSHQDYQKATEQARTLSDEIDALTQQGVKWRTDCVHESSMILTGNLLVVGGAGAVGLYDIETGHPVNTLIVDSEARGLAAADGRLFVSTVAGKVYCFADAWGPQPTADATSPADAKEPYAADDLSELYADAAEQIIAKSGVSHGYCVVAGNRDGRLAYELAKRSTMKIYGVESDSAKVDHARSNLARAGLYGHRITVDHVELATYPYPNYFANLIVVDSLLTTGSMRKVPVEIVRHLKPYGGVLCLGVPEHADESIKRQAQDEISAWIDDAGLSDANVEIKWDQGWAIVTRQSLTGTSGWTHQYGNPANTSTIDDHRIRGGVRVLWYGDPGPSLMLNRHQGAVGPVSAAGRLFVQSENSVMAYDAFNGEFLWQQYNPQALRTGVFNNFEPGNLVASEQSVFMVTEDRCVQMDAAHGRVIRTFEIPSKSNDKSRQWGYVAYDSGRLYGTSTVRKMIAAEARRRGRAAEASNTDEIFAYDVESGDLLWTHRGQSISHTAIAIDGPQLFFVDAALTAEQREWLLRQDKTELLALTGEARQIAEDRLKRIDARRAVSIDSATGAVKWSVPVDVTDCTGVGIGAGRLTIMVADGRVVLCGANANGHYWKQFLAGEFKRRRLVVLSAQTGEKLWARDANYRHRPIIVGKRVVAEPWAYSLETGEQLMRTHPLTGEETPWKFIRPGHHCGAISATPNLMFFRSKFTAYYDFESDEGTNHFAGHRLGCWINTIPANGLVMIPEASAGCACLFSLTSTIVFEPNANASVWSVYTAEGPTRPVQNMAINLGAPGDRRDIHGKLWLSYPRPSSRDGLDLPLEIRPLSPFAVSGDYYQYNSEGYAVENTDVPWLFASGMTGVTQLELPLIDEGQPSATYTVRLYCVGTPNDQPGQRVFDVLLQGNTVDRKVDVIDRAGAARRALKLEYHDVPVDRDLVIRLAPKHGTSIDQLPSVCAIEVLRTGSEEIRHNVAQASIGGR